MGKYRIHKYKKTLTLLFASSSTVITETDVELNGVLLGSTIKTAAAVDSSATTKVEITDADGIIKTIQTGLAVNTNTNLLLANDATRLPLNGLYTITVTFSAAQSANRNTDVSLFIDRG